MPVLKSRIAPFCFLVRWPMSCEKVGRHCSCLILRLQKRGGKAKVHSLSVWARTFIIYILALPNSYLMKLMKRLDVAYDR